jgi:polyphosphate kinase 2 (PPK2 family)
LPELGRIAIFNRSYYEEVAIVRVHEAVLAREPVAAQPLTDHIWRDRFADINAFEEHLTRNGTVILKFFLNVSKDEQRKRLLKRIDTPTKNWKFSDADVHERAYWDAYQHAYETALTQTNTAAAPWYVIPADHKWFSRAAISNLIVARISALRLAYPGVSAARQAELLVERRRLENNFLPVSG